MQFGHALPRGEEDRFSQPYRRTVLAPPHTTHKTHTRARTHIHTLHHTHASAHTPLHSGSRATTWIMNAMTFHIAPTVGAGGLLCFVSKYRHPSPHRPQLLELGLVNAIICHQARRPAQRLSHSSPTPLTLPLAPYPTHPTTLHLSCRASSVGKQPSSPTARCSATLRSRYPSADGGPSAHTQRDTNTLALLMFCTVAFTPRVDIPAEIQVFARKEPAREPGLAESSSARSCSGCDDLCQASQLALESLINFETIALFGKQDYECRR